MKMSLLVFVLCIGGSITATAQNIVASLANSQPQMLVLADNPQHASQAPMAVEHDLLEHGGSTSAQGERPLWEVMPEVPRIPLGDIAREFKKEHEAARKAALIWVN
jgi:hypothetical protein